MSSPNIPDWIFALRGRGQKVRNPQNDEFFSTSAIRDVADSLVREGIQNALDAGIRDPAGEFIDPVRVRIAINRGGNAAKPDVYRPFFNGLWPHLKAGGNGLSAESLPNPEEDCPYLVFEDFNTGGLTGNVDQYYEIEGVKNPFFYFFRGEGITAKSGMDLGRRGVGKIVFPRAGRVKTVFGYTIRADDKKRLLMGATTLRPHCIDGQHYMPDGTFGVPDGNDGFVLPASEASILAAFRKAFSLRREEEAGLSIVVPWIDDAVDRRSLLSAAVQGYFVPILQGSLIVSICEGDKEVIIDADTFKDQVAALGDRQLGPLVALAEWGIDRKPIDFLELGMHPGNKPEWGSAQFDAGRLEKLQELLKAHRRAALKIPMRIHKKGDEPLGTYFHVFLEEDREGDGRPLFVRNGIQIPDVRPARDPGTRSLVLVEHKPLSEMLGNAENPAHTQWQKDSSNFRGLYYYGPDCLRFVSQSVHEILGFLRAKDKQGDRWLLADVFSVEEREGEPEGREGRRLGADKKESEHKAPPPILPKPKFYRIQSARGGFSVLPGPAPASSYPRKLIVAVAYDVRRGNPFYKYAEDDFRLIQAPLRIEGKEQGLKIASFGGNQLTLEIKDPSFSLTIVGFDTRRDIIVRAREEGKPNDQAN